MHVLNVSLEMGRLVVFAATQCASVVFLARVVEHVHFQVGLVDEALIALRTFHFGFWLVVADRVELERSLGLEVLIALVAGKVFLRTVRVLKF